MNIQSTKPVQLSSRKTLAKKAEPKKMTGDTYQPSSEGSFKESLNNGAWAIAGAAIAGSALGLLAGSGGLSSVVNPFNLPVALVGGSLGAVAGAKVSKHLILNDKKNKFERGANSLVWAAASGTIGGAVAGMVTAAVSGGGILSPYPVIAALVGCGVGAWAGEQMGGQVYDSV